MNKKRNIIVIIIVFAVLFVVWAINFFIYPFSADSPNFSDVEKVFSRIQIPSDWQLIEETENRGRFGRTCPIESSGCFSITKKVTIPDSVTLDEIVNIMKSSGCSSVSVIDNTKEGQVNKKYRLACSTDNAINIGSDLDYEDRELFISVRSY